MKKISFITLLLVINISYAQKNYGTFQARGGEIISSVVLEGKSKGNVYLDLDAKGDQSIKFKDLKERQVFIDFLNSSITKFKEWKQKAIENDIKDLIKEIESANVGSALVFHYGDWNFAYGKTTVIAKMSVSEDGQNISYALVIPKRTSSKNEYIKSETSVIIFENEEGVLGLTELLKDKVINAFLDEELKKKDVFN